MKKKYTTHSAEQTHALGREFASELRGGEVVLLFGDLGAGKTALTKGIAEGLGIGSVVVSPTFLVMKVYRVHKKKSAVALLIHVDTYRMHTADDLRDVGLEEYLGRLDTVTVIEWPEKLMEAFEQTKNVLEVRLEHGKKEAERKVAFTPRSRATPRKARSRRPSP